MNSDKWASQRCGDTAGMVETKERWKHESACKKKRDAVGGMAILWMVVGGVDVVLWAVGLARLGARRRR